MLGVKLNAPKADARYELSHSLTAWRLQLYFFPSGMWVTRNQYYILGIPPAEQPSFSF